MEQKYYKKWECKKKDKKKKETLLSGVATAEAAAVGRPKHMLLVYLWALTLFLHKGTLVYLRA